ncbi:hypothetical protein GOP47_0018050 [Adiantum capillus-veneris]|uniref:Uncharacterized protein n=1 Tax=Adiantum capillus-veneris TaxID=13818 RepID=A0A9D4ZB89_ADICA|nr:hypothetical protein GOP47_0018050 [Adiantum capillus-veneris]
MDGPHRPMIIETVFKEVGTLKFGSKQGGQNKCSGRSPFFPEPPSSSTAPLSPLFLLLSFISSTCYLSLRPRKQALLRSIRAELSLRLLAAAHFLSELRSCEP